MSKVLMVMLLLVSCAALAQTFDPGKHGTAVVKTKSGHSCSYDVIGSEKPDSEQVAQMKELCEREERGQAILGVTGPTNRDFSNMTPAQKQAYRCNVVRQRIETQKDLEAAGSSGVYNLDTLSKLEVQECGSNKP